MRNIFLTFVIFAFLAPAGSAFGQSVATATFANQNEALAHKMLLRSCARSRFLAANLQRTKRKFGVESYLLIAMKNMFGTEHPPQEDGSWLVGIAIMMDGGNKSIDDVFKDCLDKGTALHDGDRRRISNILTGKGE